ncbi:hypothetical protein PZA11_000803 [Diplocarpon coronariae]
MLAMGSISNKWRELDIAVIGGGIGGLATATSLRQAGHRVTIYERADYAGEVGASISCAANGTRFLEKWGVDIPIGRPVILQKLISRDWATGEPTNIYDLADYKERWGSVYNMFHRVDMHAMLMDSATAAKHPGVPAVLKVNHKALGIGHEAGTITFENGVQAKHDLVIGADGIGSQVRRTIGVFPDRKQSTSHCYHCIIATEDVKKLGLHDFTPNEAIEYWGGQDIYKIVFSPCREGELHSFYCFFPAHMARNPGEGWNHSIPVEELLQPFESLDPDLLALFKNSTDIKPWRLFVHQPYPHWQKGRTCILGDAAHPMMPDQSQGACMAIEDAGALGIIFSDKFSFTCSAEEIKKGLQLYEQVRKPRATRVQAASARARENITERIGFSSNTSNPLYKVADESAKLTIEEMNEYDMYADIEQKVGGSERSVFQARLRKKSRCPGEKPVCSHCARLQQSCGYADAGDNEHEHDQEKGLELEPNVNVNLNRNANPDLNPDLPTWPQRGLSEAVGMGAVEGRLEDRLHYLESQLADVLVNQATLMRSVSHQVFESTSSASNQVVEPPKAVRHVQPSLGQLSDSSLPSWEVILGAAQTYLNYCDCQPLPLFQRSNFLLTLKDRQPEVVYSILALASRFISNNVPCNDQARLISGYVEAARTINSKKLFEGAVDLSTIQSMCLLTLVDFTDGHTRRASIHSSQAMSLAQNAGLASESPHALPEQEREERRRCFWSLFLLKRLHGADFMILDFSAEDNFPWYPESASEPSPAGRRLSPAQDGGQGSDKGIVAYAIQLSEVWFKITRYARRRGKPSCLPPWSSQSEYATILAHQMDFETRMPFVHRFEPAKFSQRSVEHLNSNRDYWGPWLFIQFLYHTNLCLLNHPLLISLRLRDFKCVIPEIFLQHSSDLISSHASWILNLMEMLEAKPFKVTDPFLGHCVAIIATIYLQESFSEDAETRREKQDSFERCLKFIRGFGDQWPHLGRIANKLQRLAETVSSTYVASEEPTRQNRKLLIDLGQFFEVLEYSCSSELPGSARQLFGPSLHSSFGGSRRTEMAQTSVLPQPTRVERQEFGKTPTPNTAHATGPLEHPSLLSSGPGSAVTAPPVYSDDELAVLAESFFHQRHEFDGSANWWQSMSMDAI